MNILDIEIGKIGVAADGTRYHVLGDSKERNSFLGIISIRIAKDQDGKIHKFIRGIEVEPS